MKIPARTVRFALFPAIAILAVIGLSVCAQGPGHRWPPTPGHCRDAAIPHHTTRFYKKILTRSLLKKDNEDGEKEFAALLCNGHYNAEWGTRIHMIHQNAYLGSHCLPQDCSDFAQASIKTEKVIVSEKAKAIADEPLTSITRHVTQQIVAQNQPDLDAALSKVELQ